MNYHLIFEELRKVSFSDVYNLFFHSNYFSFYFFIYCFYVCYYLRIVAPIGGLNPCRSFLLGLVLSYGHRFCYGRIVNVALPEMENSSVFIKYSLVWISMNLCPFDLVFQIVRNALVRTLLQLISTFGNTLLLNSTLYQLLSVYPGEYLKVLVCCVFSFSFPCFLDYFDSELLGKKRDFSFNRTRHYIMFYPFHWIKRLTLVVFLELALSQSGWVLSGKYTFPLHELNIPFALSSSVFSIIDLITHQGNPFFMFDFIFPKIFENFFTYYPAKECQGVHEAIYVSAPQ